MTTFKIISYGSPDWEMGAEVVFNDLTDFRF